jgi:hypothetical protein
MPSFGGEAARISRNTSLWTYIYILYSHYIAII